MKIDISVFNRYYYLVTVILGIVAFTFNHWYGIAIWAFVSECIFHEPVHWAMARLYGFNIVSMVNARKESYIDVKTTYNPGDDKKLGYVCLAGVIFNLVMYLIAGLSLAMAGAIFSGFFFVIAMEVVDLYYGQDFRMFWKLSVMKT